MKIENTSGRKSKREYKWMKIENTSERKSKREYKWMKIENISGRKSKREYKWMKIENRIENRKYNSMKIENRVENRKYNSMKSALLGHRNAGPYAVSYTGQTTINHTKGMTMEDMTLQDGGCIQTKLRKSDRYAQIILL